MQKYTLEEFKNFIIEERQKKQDIIDFKNGKMTIHRCNINKYLEEYACRDEEDFGDTMWYSYGCLVKIID